MNSRDWQESDPTEPTEERAQALADIISILLQSDAGLENDDA